MKKLILLLAFAMPFVLSSCNPDDPPANTYDFYYTHNGLVTYACCKGTGTTCNKLEWSFVRTTFKAYADNDDVKGFFINENWQQYMPELQQRPELVKEIIDKNPRAVFLNDVSFVLLKDRDKPVSQDNTLHGFFDRAASEPCDKVKPKN
jgi:hypothetical protein